jgi:WD40 repeat protein
VIKSVRLPIILIFLSTAAVVAADPPAPKSPADVLLPPGAIRRFGETGFRHRGGIHASILSADGKWLATAARRSIIVWDTSTGLACRRIDAKAEHLTFSRAMSFSPDGTKLAASAGPNADVFVWDVSTGKEIKHLSDPLGVTRGFAGLAEFSADGRELAVSRGEMTEFHDTQAWKVTRKVQVPGWLVSPVGPTVIGRTGRGKVLLTDLSRDSFTLKLKLETHESGLALSPDGRTLAAFTTLGRLELWSVPDGKVLKSEEVWGDARSGLIAFVPDGKTLYLATPDEISCWDFATMKVVAKVATPAGANVTGMHVLPDGDTLIVCTRDGLIRRFSRKLGSWLPGVHAGYVGPLSAAATRDGLWLAVGDRSGRIDIWETKTGKLARILSDDGPPIGGLAFNSDGKALAIGHRTVELRNLQDGTSVRLGVDDHSPTRDGVAVRILGFAPDGRVLWSAFRGGRFWVWVHAAETVRLMGAGTSPLGAFTPDGKVLLSSRNNAELTFVDPTNGSELRRAKLSSDDRDQWRIPPTAVAFSPDGRRLAVATADGRIHLCDPTTGQELATFPELTPAADANAKYRTRVSTGAQSLAFSPDGHWLLSGEPSGGVRVWEVCSRRQAYRLAGHDWGASFVAFGPGGKTALSAGGDGAVYQWDMRPRDRLASRSVWDDLADGDTAFAYRAVWAMIDDPANAIKALRANLSPASGPTAAELARLIGQLNANQFAAREAATRTLADLGPLAMTALRAAADGKLSAEARERVTKLLGRKADDLSPSVLRTIRGVQVLERIGSPDALALLKELAAGADGAPVTEYARWAVKRLEARK